jgi:hypothetical protein
MNILLDNVKIIENIIFKFHIIYSYSKRFDIYFISLILSIISMNNKLLSQIAPSKFHGELFQYIISTKN